MSNLQELRMTLLESEEKRRSMWNLYKRTEPKIITLKSEEDPEFIGFTSIGSRFHQERAAKEFNNLFRLFKQIGVLLTFDKKRKIPVIGYQNKALIFQKRNNRYIVVSGKAYLDITELIKSLDRDIKDRSIIFSLRSYERVRRDLYGVQTIFFDEWKEKQMEII